MFTFHVGTENCASIYLGVKDIEPATVNRRIHSAKACGMNTELETILMSDLVKSANNK